METIKCPYCECKVRMSDVETDDGTCPECGAPLLGSLMMTEFQDDTDDDFDEDGLLSRPNEVDEEDLDEDD